MMGCASRPLRSGKCTAFGRGRLGVHCGESVHPRSATASEPSACREHSSGHYLQPYCRLLSRVCALSLLPKTNHYFPCPTRVQPQNQETARSSRNCTYYGTYSDVQYIYMAGRFCTTPGRCLLTRVGSGHSGAFRVGPLSVHWSSVQYRSE